jgi:phosphoglycerol transferase MdoB-like AlkP superfamily enzyme
MPESEKERLDRELNELLQELRVALPGVQVLFAFLLTVAFSQRFAQLTSVQRNVYFATFLATAVTSVMFIAPTAYHRIRWREYDKEQMLVTSTHLTLAGVVFLALSITGTVFLITDVMFGVGAAALSAAVIAGLLAWFWFGLPVIRKLGEGDARRGR